MLWFQVSLVNNKNKRLPFIWRFEVIVLKWQQVWKWTFSGGKMLRGWIWLANLFFHTLLWLAGFNANSSTTKLLSLIISQTVDSGEENVDESRTVSHCLWSNVSIFTTFNGLFTNATDLPRCGYLNGSHIMLLILTLFICILINSGEHFIYARVKLNCGCFSCWGAH